ncbi:acyl transferase 4 isoform X2 [Cicer arietinum]|uniref:Acyl transferase 4 n=1 Tax=Cicer arietinum TaxID=3827 RepID=A0A1S2XTV9_CICAR|nr:acyl transferase 4 [Cicer arietinum]
MAMFVIRTKRGLVKPAKDTLFTTLDLSIIDKLPVLRCNFRTLHVFRHGPEAARVIREALSLALVPYYPLAGRLKEFKPRCLQIECSGDGVWYVEASTDCTLDSVNFFDDMQSISYDNLLPDDIPEIEHIDPLVQMQVTQFSCGGFVIGLVFSHSICDGLGAAQFLNAVGELARGLDKPTIEPVWHRNFSLAPQPPALPKRPPADSPQMPHYKLEHANIDIPMDQINRLKKEFQQVTERSCSTFDIVASLFWSSRTKAINFDPNTQVKLVFFANCRHLMEPPLPNGFYGNCFFPVTTTASCESLRKAHNIVEVVKLIQVAKAKLHSEFGKYLKGEHLKVDNEVKEDPFAPTPNYATLFMSEWGRLGFDHVDYKWGPPVHVVPIQGSSIVPAGIMRSLPLPNRGIRLATWCVEEAHRLPFIDQIHGVINQQLL